MIQKLSLVCFFFLVTVLAWTQEGCPGCEVSLPEDLPEDTIFLSAATPGQANVYYDNDLSFRLPKTTTPVAAIDSTTPPNLPISSFEIVSVGNLPPGLRWEANQRVFNTSEETDGCVKFCGTPLLPGLYMVEVVVEAQVVILTERTSFSFPLLIQPSVSSSEGFRMINNVGCGELEVTFINTLPSNGMEGFSYRWDFGNGLISEEENPGPLTFDQAGTYVVDYQAVIDTADFLLTKVVIEDTNCSDILGGRPDLKIDVLNPEGLSIYTSDIITNAETPLTFELLVPIDTGNYSIRLTDDDSGIGGADDICGVVNFTQTTTGLLTDGDDLSLTLTILHPVDTVQSSDTVYVFAQPVAPVIEPSFNLPLCDGDTASLAVVNFEGGLQWIRDSSTVFEAIGPVLSVTESGTYWARYISPDGCSSSSDVENLSFGIPPSGVAFSVENNRLTVFDPASLPENSQFEWAANGERIPGAEGLSYCIDSSANYTLTVTDPTNGCSSSFSQQVTFNSSFPNCVSNTIEFEEATAVIAYPNPTAGQLNVEWTGTAFRPEQYQLVDVRGRVINKGFWRDLPGTPDKKVLSLYELKKGIYILHLFSDPLQQTIKVVKE